MAKTGLGRGLGALMGDAPVAASPAPLTNTGALRVPLNQIRPCPVQPRRDFDRLALEELAVSIEANGIVQPLVVRQKGDHYELIAGERRWRAADIASQTDVPVVVREASDAEVLEMALIENLQREDLNPIEEAQGFQNLIDLHGYTQEEAGARVGKNRATVANALRLLKLDSEVQVHVRQGRLSTGHAKALAALEDPARQRQAAQRVIQDGLNVRDTEKLAARLQKNETNDGPAAGATPDVHVADLQNRLTEALATKVSLSYRKGKGSLTIRFYNDDDLERILEQLGVSPT